MTEIQSPTFNTNDNGWETVIGKKHKQSNYVAPDEYLDSLNESRTSQNLPTFPINFYSDLTVLGQAVFKVLYDASEPVNASYITFQVNLNERSEYYKREIGDTLYQELCEFIDSVYKDPRYWFLAWRPIKEENMINIAKQAKQTERNDIDIGVHEDELRITQQASRREYIAASKLGKTIVDILHRAPHPISIDVLVRHVGQALKQTYHSGFITRVLVSELRNIVRCVYSNGDPFWVFEVSQQFARQLEEERIRWENHTADEAY